MVETRRDTQAGAEIQKEYVRTNPNVQIQNMREFCFSVHDLVNIWFRTVCVA